MRDERKSKSQIEHETTRGDNWSKIERSGRY